MRVERRFSCHQIAVAVALGNSVYGEIQEVVIHLWGNLNLIFHCMHAIGLGALHNLHRANEETEE